MAQQRGFDITDPKHWDLLGKDGQIAAIVEMQSILVIQSLKNTKAGKILVDRRAKGQRLDREVLFIEHRNEVTVDLKTRRKMEEAEMAGAGPQNWRVRLYPLDGQPPKRASKDLKHWFTMAKKYAPRPGTDLHCIIAAEKKVFLVGVVLDKYLEAITEAPAEPVAEATSAP
jgi:hypothetical protein